MTFSPAAQNALSFAKAHDWGQHAFLTMVDGVETVAGIIERWVGADDRLLTFPALRSELRAWFY